MAKNKHQSSVNRKQERQSLSPSDQKKQRNKRKKTDPKSETNGEEMVVESPSTTNLVSALAPKDPAVSENVNAEAMMVSEPQEESSVGTSVKGKREHRLLAGGTQIWSTLIASGKDTWHTVDQEIRNSFNPFVDSDKEEVGTLALQGCTTNSLGGKKWLKPAGWLALFKDVFSTTSELANCQLGEDLRSFGMRLALTEPYILFEDADILDFETERLETGLADTLTTCAWTGAYLYFGAIWKCKPTFSEYFKVPTLDLTQEPDDDMVTSSEDEAVVMSKLAPPTKKKSPKKVGFVRQLYITKPKPIGVPPKRSKKTKAKTKHTTFIKIRTARLQEVSLMDLETEFVKIFHDTLTKFWQDDPTLLVLPWHLDSVKPIKKGSKIPSNRDSIAQYVDNIFLKHGNSCWVRMRIGHTKPSAFMEEESFQTYFRDRGILIAKEKLQMKVTQKAGWLLGSHPTAFNPRDLEQALEHLPELKGIPIEVRIDYIRVKAEGRTNTKAAQIFCSWDATQKCRRALNTIYKKKNVDGYPLGKNMRFVPNIMDRRFITTPSTRKKVQASIQKQTKFLASVETTKNYTICGLDYYDEKLKQTLRQALMGIRSTSQPDRNLFLAVDTFMQGETVVFLFKKDLAHEANTLIPALPLLLEVTLDSTRVWNWFHEEAKMMTEGFYWDPRRGILEIDGDDEDSWGGSLESSDDEFSLSSGVSRESTALEPFQITNAPGKNEFYDESSTLGDEWSQVTKRVAEPAPAPPIASGVDAAGQPVAASSETTLISPSSTLTSSQDWENFLTQKLADATFCESLLQRLSKPSDSTSNILRAAPDAEGAGG